MKKYDIVRLNDEKNYQDKNLDKGLHGIVVDLNVDSADILFFNPKKIGDYLIANVLLRDITLEKEKLPNECLVALKNKLQSLNAKTKDRFDNVMFNDYDIVELIVEDEKYIKYGIHKGDVGCVMDSVVTKNYIEVDFSGIDSEGKFYGECIPIRVSDLRLKDKKT